MFAQTNAVIFLIQAIILKIIATLPLSDMFTVMTIGFKAAASLTTWRHKATISITHAFHILLHPADMEQHHRLFGVIFLAT